ncbi:MAG: hypothetical protein ACRENL_02790 [Candidatus Dormibacteria bacterium]
MATAPKSDRKPANRRSGRTKGYRSQRGGAHQIEWQDDPVILGRIRAGMVAWAERKPPLECLAEVNDWLRTAHPKEAPIALRTMYEDRTHAAELVAIEVMDAQGEHLLEYDHVIAESYQAFHDAKDSSLNRSAFLSTIAATIERKAKLRGLLDPKLRASVSGSVRGEPIEFSVVFDRPNAQDSNGSSPHE